MTKNNPHGLWMVPENMGSANDANHLKGDIPFDAAVQFPVMRLRTCINYVFEWGGGVY